MDIESKKMSMLTDDTLPSSLLSWSIDGKYLRCLSLLSNGNQEIFTIDCILSKSLFSSPNPLAIALISIKTDV